MLTGWHGSPDDDPELAAIAAEAKTAAEDIDASLQLADRLGQRMPNPGSGQTRRRWQILAAVAAGDLTAARVLEPHADALAILSEAQSPAQSGTWGVFASEAPGKGLSARLDDGQWLLTGSKPWCSLGGVLDHALVTALADDRRLMFAVDLRQAGVTAHETGWVARGMRTLTSGPIDFDAVPATPIGESGWYLQRPGFSWGGMGVAACWFGGAVALAHRLSEALRDRDPSDIAHLQLGRVHVALHAAAASLEGAAAQIDAGHPASVGTEGELLAATVRTIVAEACELTLEQVGHALGPGPLAFDDEHARRVADLTLYLRQHHAERDVADIGTRVLARRGTEPE